MGESAVSITVEIHMQAHKKTAISTALQHPKFWERFTDDVYSVLKPTHLEYASHHFPSQISIKSSIFIKTLSLLRRKKVMENYCLFSLYSNEVMGSLCIGIYECYTYGRSPTLQLSLPNRLQVKCCFLFVQ